GPELTECRPSHEPRAVCAVCPSAAHPRKIEAPAPPPRFPHRESAAQSLSGGRFSEELSSLTMNEGGEAISAVSGGAQPSSPAFDTCVVIPTYRRPSILRSAVDSVLAQQGVTQSVELLVVDNDPGRSAETCVRDIASNSPLPVRYLCEPRAGISHARNAAVAAASCRYLAFLDHDEEASPHWLASMRAAAGQYNADIVVGPVRPRFPQAADVPDYAKRIYNRDALVATGTIIQWAGIGNSLLDRERCFATSTPFDP